MSQPVAPQFQPVHIGEEADPPAAVLPDPATLFSQRAQRLRAVAPGHRLEPYLAFVADIADAQASMLADLPAPVLPLQDELDRALEHGMAPIARARLPVDSTMLAALELLLARMRNIAMPDAAATARDNVSAADEAMRREMCANVLDDAFPVDAIAEHVFVAAALQTHFARLAAMLPVERMKAVADRACPACGGPPSASSVVGGRRSQSVRFCVCATCATQWHVVRIKCVACSSTQGIHYLFVEGAAETVKAECCDECRSYLKIFYNSLDPSLDPIADDIASADLDLLVREKGFGRAGFNPFLAGF